MSTEQLKTGPEWAKELRGLLADGLGWDGRPHELKFIMDLAVWLEYQRWRPIETAPRDGTYFLVAGNSGYMTTPLRVEVCRYDAQFRRDTSWINHANERFSDGGDHPTVWMPLPDSAGEAGNALIGVGRQPDSPVSSCPYGHSWCVTMRRCRECGREGGKDASSTEGVRDNPEHPPVPLSDDDKCPRCEGTGKYQRGPLDNEGPCSICNGTGLMEEAVKSAEPPVVTDIAALRDVLGKATPGPWYSNNTTWSDARAVWNSQGGEPDEFKQIMICEATTTFEAHALDPQRGDNLIAIVALRNAATALLDEVEDGRKAIARLKASGFTKLPGCEWKPPVGQTPDFIIHEENVRLKNAEAVILDENEKMKAENFRLRSALRGHILGKEPKK